MKDELTLTAGNSNLAGNVIQLMNDILAWQPHIERALRDLDGMYTFNDVVARVLRQEIHFMDFGDCCVFMQVETFPGYKQYHCFLACGAFEGLLRVEPVLTDMAKRLGCKYFSLAGRKGWERMLKNHGWKHVVTVMHKELD